MGLPRLVALTPGDLGEGGGREGPRDTRVASLASAVARAVAAGLRGLLVREPHLGDRSLLELVAVLRAPLQGRAGAWLCVHDRPHVARLAGADACHLGFRSLAPGEVRVGFPDHAGQGLALGLSTHAGDDVAAWSAADYLFHGPLRASGSHPAPGRPDWREPVGPEGLARAVAATERPVLALGGIRPGDVAAALRAGAHGVAVLSGILGSDDPGRATGAYLAALAAPAVSKRSPGSS